MSYPSPSHSPRGERGPPSPARGEGYNCTDFPLPLREREGPAAQRWEGEGERPGWPSKAELLARARWMRANPTDAERRIWTLVRDRRIEHFKFKRQQIIAPYIVDFICLSARLIVEADGSQHADNRYDERRDSFLAGQRFQVLRFWNNDVLDNSDGVFDAIYAALLTPSPSQACGLGPSLSRKGRGVADGAAHA